MSLLKVCKQYGLSYSRVKYAMYKGYSLAEAIEYAKTDHRKLLYYNGVFFKDYCAREGLSYKAVLGRMYKDKITLDEAINTVRRVKGYSDKGYKGKNYKHFIGDKPVKPLLSRNEYQRFLRLVKKMSVEKAFNAVRTSI